jgi:LysM repeat protein
MMKDSNSAQKVITSYRKRQQRGPYVIGGFAIALVVIGIVVLVIWLTGKDRPIFGSIATATSTLTDTPTNTLVPPTSTFTATVTVTETPTITQTSTPSGPFSYTVQQGDTCYDVAVKFKVNLDVLIALNPSYGANCTIAPGDELLIPLANQVLPTDTPIPAGLPAGTKIEYVVKTGDTVRGLAIRFNSTVDSIVTTNKLTNSNDITVGQKLIILVNIVTPYPTSTNTKTPGPGTVYPTSTPTMTPTLTATLTATVAATQ